MGYIDELTGSHASILREEHEFRQENDTLIKKRLHDLVQSDEQKKVTGYSEGFCYGCNKYDRVLSNMWYACHSCSVKRGREGLLADVKQKFSEELCDFCGKWDIGIWQKNVSLCDSCRRRVTRIHKKYKKGGGYEKMAPFQKRMFKKYGKDYQKILLQSF